MPSDAASDPDSPPVSLLERRTYIRRNVWRTLVSVVVLFGLLLAASIKYDAEIRVFTQWVFQFGGLWGLGLLVFLADSITSPIPPDFVLLVVATTNLKLQAWWLIPLGGGVSTTAGVAGWYLGGKLSEHRRLGPWLAKVSLRHASAITKYGRLTVALGALTPLPFSITCWTAGALKMPFGRFLPVSLLRLPRYVLFYLLIAYTQELSQQISP